MPRRLARGRSAAGQRLLDLLVGLVLAQRVHGPDRGGNPADQRDLEDQAEDAGEGAADGEELEPGEQEGEEQAHRERGTGNGGILPMPARAARTRPESDRGHVRGAPYIEKGNAPVRSR